MFQNISKYRTNISKHFKRRDKAPSHFISNGPALDFMGGSKVEMIGSKLDYTKFQLTVRNAKRCTRDQFDNALLMCNTLTRLLVFVMLHAKGAQESSISYNICLLDMQNDICIFFGQTWVKNGEGTWSLLCSGLVGTFFIL